MNNERLLTMPVTINYIDGKKVSERERVSGIKLVCCHRCTDERVYLLRLIRLVIFSEQKKFCSVRIEQSPNNNHKYLVHILGSCYCLLAGFVVPLFRYRHHKTNPIITFQFNCVKPVTLTVSRDRPADTNEVTSARARCTTTTATVTAIV